MTPVLDRAFNLLTVTMAMRKPWEIVAYNPYPTLADMQADYAKTGRIKVTSLHSDNSIYGDPWVNCCARAWHDYAHLYMRAEFNAEGERLAAEFQITQMHARNGWNAQSRYFERIIDCEVNGQVAHYMAHGSFPENGYKFSQEHLA